MPTNWAGITIEQLKKFGQWEFIEKIKNNPNETQLLLGVAGSGKTLVAAIALAELQSSKNIELLVFTNLLEQYIRQNFEDKSVSLAVDHYHSWDHKNPSPRKDIFIVDEAQDFKKDWIEKVKSNSQSQIWVGDIQQQIYIKPRNDNGFIDEINTLKESQKTIFEINHRSSLKNARFASNFITITPDEQAEGLTLEKKQANFLDPIKKSDKKRNESPVTLIKADSIEQEYETIIKLIQQIQNNKEQKSRRIAIAHLRHNKSEKDTVDISVDRISLELTQRGVLHYRKEKEFNHTNLPDFSDDNLIVVSPISSLKGLEFDHIFFPHSEYASFFDDPIIRDNLLFVLFTRASQGVYCSYVDEQTSYVWDRIKDERDLDEYIVKNDAKDILNPSSGNSNTTSPNVINI